MDSAAQAAGERRVRAVLIEPLGRRGLAKPASLTKAQMEEMLEDVCRKLAYMSALNLAALEEHVAANPGGKDRDRLPIAQRILEAAARIQPPGDDASPLMRAVFAHGIGRDAIAEGWAPELLANLRRTRQWPTSFVLLQLQEEASAALRMVENARVRAERGSGMTPDEERMIAHREAVLAKCRAIADAAGGDA